MSPPHDLNVTIGQADPGSATQSLICVLARRRAGATGSRCIDRVASSRDLAARQSWEPDGKPH
jgi:hypothetical protein